MKTDIIKNLLSILILSIYCYAGAVELKLFDEDVSGWNNRAILSSNYKVSMDFSMKWDNYGTGNSLLSVSTPTLPNDLSHYTTISFWMYSPGTTNSEFNIILHSPDGYFYKIHNVVDWQGWKKITFPLSSFKKAYSADITNVIDISFYNYGWDTQYVPGAEVYLDSIYLSDADNNEEFILLDDDSSSWSNLTFSEEQVKRGEASGKWNAFGEANSIVEISGNDIPTDWTNLYSVSFWVYSTAASAAKVNIIISAGESYFCKTQIPVDWEGWKRIEFPLSSFENAYGTADWADVKALKLYNFGWGIAPVGDSALKIYFDDIRLNYSYKVFFDDKVSTFLNTTKETDNELIWKGKASALLAGFDTSNKIYELCSPEITTDWTNYDTLSFRIHSSSASGSAFNLIISAGDSYFCKTQIPVDWEGWKRFEFPLSSFENAYGTADWTDVKAMKFYNFGWGIAPANNGTKIHIDDIELYKRSTFTGINFSNIINAAKNSGDPHLDFPTLINRGYGLVTLKRPYSLNEIITYGNEAGLDLWDDRLDNFPDSHPNKLIFGLAMADCHANFPIRMFDASLRVISENCPDALSYIVSQLSEITGYNTGRPAWHPLQRPGWTKYDYNDYTPLGEENEGENVWLATGWDLFAIIDTLVMVGDRLDAELKEKCIEFIKDEIDVIDKSWNTSMPWYCAYPGSNQLVLPNAGLLYACLYTGRMDSSFGLAVRNILSTLNVMGQDGASLEGFGYNDMIMPYVCRAVMMLKDNTKINLLNNAFLQKNGDWIISHLMPGYYMLNDYDATKPIYERMPESFGMLSALYKRPEYFWIGENIYNNNYPFYTLTRLLYFYNKQGQGSSAPLHYGYYPSRNLVSWRSGWDNDNDIGIWAKGSSAKDRHCHDDAGHVTIINGAEQVLIETGVFSYGNLDKEKYQSVTGHNVLQATAAPQVRDCLLTVNSLDSNGGNITINATPAYEDVDNWQRNIVFNSSSVTITDNVDLSQNKVGGVDEWLRFHTGSQEPVTISGSGLNWTVTWGNNQITFAANKSILVSQVEWVDGTLSRAEGTHYCIVIKVDDATDTLNIVTTVSW